MLLRQLVIVGCGEWVRSDLRIEVATVINVTPHQLLTFDLLDGTDRKLLRSLVQKPLIYVWGSFHLSSGNRTVFVSVTVAFPSVIPNGSLSDRLAVCKSVYPPKPLTEDLFGVAMVPLFVGKG